MYTVDDRETAKLGDRLIAAVIAALLGLLIGSLLAAGAASLFGDRYGVHWIVAGLSGAYGFIAPARSRALWSAFWEEILGWLSTRK
jgi:hypothetical protein